MMGLGSMGNGGVGNSSSSTSNLSPLAPPFTVDRLNPKPNSNPLLHYPESSYMVEPFSHQWQYARPSAPGPEIIDSTGIASLPVSDDYRFSASSSISPSSTQWSALSPGTKAMGGGFAYGGEVKPYYNPYVPSMVGEDSLLVEDGGSRYNVVPTSGLSATSQHDYTQDLFDLEYGPQWMDSLGFDDGKRAKRSEFDGSFSSEKATVASSQSYKNQLYQGGHGGENRNKPREDSGVLYQNFDQVSDRGVHTGSSNTGYLEKKSCLEQNLGFFPYNSNGTFVSPSSSPYPESYDSYHSVVPCEMQKNVPNYQKSYSPYEKCVGPVDTPFPGPVSVVRASPTVVIRPPPASNDNLGQGITSRKPVCSENVGGVHGVDFDYTNPLKQKDPGLKPTSKTKEDSFETNLFNFSKQGNGLILSTSVKELSSPLQSMDTSDRKSKARLGSQVPDIKVSSGFAMAGDNVQVANSTEDSPDIIDHHNTAEDSPCWKGAPSSQFSTFDVEAGNSHYAKVNLDERHGVGHEEHKSLHPMVDSNRVFSEKVEGNMGIGNECTRNGVGLAFERTLDAICSTKEQGLLDGRKDTAWTSPVTRGKGVELSDGPNIPGKESNLLNNLTTVFDVKVSDTKHLIGEEGAGITVNDVSEGASVAVHAAEKVLSSPSSQEDATEHTIVPDPKLNVRAMIKTIHNLSELLQFHLSSDACSLEEENTETLKQVISNLNTCLSKKYVQATSKPEPNKPVGGTCEILGESHNVGTISGGPHMKSEAANSHSKFDYLHMHDEERNDSFSGKKDEKSPILVSLRDDLDMTGNDDMAKAIKKILEDNFQLNEDMHSQALLFKSLWLEAEAKLCSINYKARFDRMKIQMDEIQRKAPQENENIAEMMSQVGISPDPIIISKVAPKACDSTSAKPTLENVSIPSTSGHAHDIEASVLARFNILKSREEDLTPINLEEEKQPEIVGGVADSIMARFNILKSREENTKSISMAEESTEQHPEIVDGDAGSIMSRFNILRSREENTRSIGMDEEKQPKMIGGEFSGEKYLRPCIGGQSEDEMLNVALKPLFLHQTGSLSDGKFGSCVDGGGYESLNECYLSVPNDPMAHSFKSNRMINENNSGSSSSDWEHVLNEDVSWKNL